MADDRIGSDDGGSAGCRDRNAVRLGTCGSNIWHKIVPQQQWLTENGGGLMFAMVSSLLLRRAPALHLPLGAAWAIQYAGPLRARRGGVDLLEAPRSGVVAGAIRHRDLPVHALHPQLRHGGVRLRGGAVARARRQHHARPLVLDRGVDAAGDDDVRRRDLDSAGADRADHVRVLAAAAPGAKRLARSAIAAGPSRAGYSLTGSVR